MRVEGNVLIDAGGNGAERFVLIQRTTGTGAEIGIPAGDSQPNITSKSVTTVAAGVGNSYRHRESITGTDVLIETLLCGVQNLYRQAAWRFWGWIGKVLDNVDCVSAHVSTPANTTTGCSHGKVDIRLAVAVNRPVDYLHFVRRYWRHRVTVFPSYPSRIPGNCQADFDVITGLIRLVMNLSGNAEHVRGIINSVRFGVLDLDYQLTLLPDIYQLT